MLCVQASTSAIITTIITTVLYVLLTHCVYALRPSIYAVIVIITTDVIVIITTAVIVIITTACTLCVQASTSALALEN